MAGEIISMRILFVLDNGGVGGAEKFTLSLAEKLTERGHKVAIMILGKDKKILEFTTNKEIDFFFAIRRFKLDLLNFITKIKGIIIKYNPQVIVTDGLFSFFFVTQSLKSIRQKPHLYLWFNTVSAFSFKDKVFEFFYTIFLHIFKGIWIVFCPQQEDIIARRFFLRKQDIVIIPSGVDTIFYSADKFLSENQGFEKKDIFTIAHIASLKPVKDQETLFKALKIFNQRIKGEWQLLIAGQGKPGILAHYEKLLKKLSINDRVKFLGIVKDVREILILADIFVLSSRTEALPLSALEALSMGVPCILPDVGGCPYIVNEGVNGYLIKPKDIRYVADLLVNIYLNKEELKNLREQSRKIAVEKFNLDKTVDDFINLCELEF